MIGNILKIPGVSCESLQYNLTMLISYILLLAVFQNGLAYACGIILALAVCASTSGGHFNPCITVAMVIFKGFPRLKAVRYILAQIIGAYIACMLVYCQWSVFIRESEEVLHAAGAYDSVQFTPAGLGGIFAFYLSPGQSYGRVFVNEFVNVCLPFLLLKHSG